MAANRPPARARARRGSLERPINARLYRGTWLLVGIPLLIAAFSVGKPAALRAAVPTLPPAFDKARATALARDLAQTFPDRSPGSPEALSARQWFADEVGKIGLRIRREPFVATIPGRGRIHLENLIVTIPGRSPQALAVLAHLDNVGTGPGANDNASGIAALIELARSYATSVSGNAPPGASIVSPAHTLFFVATDGGEFGGLGADRFAADFRDRIVASVVLDSIAGRNTARLVIAGNTARPADPGSGARARHLQLRLPRRAGDPGLGDPARADRRVASVPDRRRRPLCPLPPASRTDRAGAAELPQPFALLALGRCGVRSLRPRRRLADRRGLATRPSQPGGPPLAAARSARPRCHRRVRVGCRALSSDAPAACRNRRGARGSHGGSAGPRRRRPARRGHQPIFPADLAPVSPRLVVAAPGAIASALATRLRLRGRVSRPRRRAGLICFALRARPRCPLVPGGAGRHPLHLDSDVRDRARVARRGGTVRRAERQAVRALPGRLRARARSDPQVAPVAGPGAACPQAGCRRAAPASRRRLSPISRGVGTRSARRLPTRPRRVG